MDIFTRRLAMGAAGAAGGDKTYVNDVYQSHLYDGISANRTIGNGIKLGTAGLGYGVQFDGHTDYLSLATSPDLAFGTGDFTIEFWQRCDGYSNNPHQLDFRVDGSNTGTTNSLVIYMDNSGITHFWLNGSIRISANATVTLLQWQHVALVRNSSTTTLYLNGISQGTYSDTTNYGSSSSNSNPLVIGQRQGNYASNSWDGSISNLRVVKGTAVYTSAFSPPTKALESIENTKLLCCNQISVLGYTVSPVPITPSTTDEDLMSSSGPFTLSADEVKGGLVWIKNRKTTGYGHFLFDTVRGIQNAMCANLTNAQFTESNGVKAFNADGFDLGDDTAFNTDGQFYQSYTFAKSEAFFDIVTYTGNASSWNSGSQTLNHNLGCTPGLIIVKSLTQGSGPPDRDWYVYHKDIPNKPLYLNLNGAASQGSGGGYVGDPRYFNDSLNNPPTATTFQVGDNVSGGGSYGGPPGFGANENGQSYLAYLFAGGPSTADTARSIEFDGSGDYLKLGASSDFAFGTGDFTIECWVDFTDTSTDNGQNRRIFALDDSANAANNFQINIDNGYRVNGSLYFWSNSLQGYLDTDIRGSWHHIAVARQSGTLRIFLDGTLKYSASNTQDYSPNSGSPRPVIGSKGLDGGNYGNLNGSISNMRVVVGTAVYTSAFRVPTEPLKNITNTKLLCCNKNTVTGSTVTSSTITSYGNPQSSTYTPFDDPEGFKFGEGGDQNIVKCGQYTGNGSTNGPEVYVGWEPQWLLIKRRNSAEDWYLVDPIRTSARQNMYLDEFRPNNNNAEGDGAGNDSQPFLNFNATGFKLMSNSGMTNSSNDNFVYIAIRREDGYVGKPPTIGSEVFTPTYGTVNAPLYHSSGHVVDYALQKSSYQSGLADWTSIARLRSNERLETNQNLAEQYNSNQNSDYQSGWSNYTGGDGTRFAWLFKRHAGMDVVTWEGNQVAGRQLPHSLNSVPEMIWAKMMTGGTNSWAVYHKGLNNGTSPQNWSLALNTNAAENGVETWQYTAPTSTHVTLGAVGAVNVNGRIYIAMLFSSVDGISKVGYYDGNGGTQTITTGFSPRFLIIKRSNISGEWYTIDTTRGWGSGNDKYLALNDSYAQQDFEFGAPTSTGFTLPSGNSGFNESGSKYIYYAHA